jgi:ElaB/YqjD/DUF883 family membrane-anchored ribosome-binding protein
MSDQQTSVMQRVAALQQGTISEAVTIAVKEMGTTAGKADAAKEKLYQACLDNGVGSMAFQVAKNWTDAEKQNAHNLARMTMFADACTARGNVIDPTTGEKTFPKHNKYGNAGKTFLKFPTADEREANLTPSECVMFDRVYNGTKGNQGVKANLYSIMVRLQRDEIKELADTIASNWKVIKDPKATKKAKADNRTILDESTERLSAYPLSQVQTIMGKSTPKSLMKKSKKSKEQDAESIKTQVLRELGSVRDTTGEVMEPWWSEIVGMEDELRGELQALLEKESFSISTLRDLVFSRYGVLDQDDGSDDS